MAGWSTPPGNTKRQSPVWWNGSLDDAHMNDWTKRVVRSKIKEDDMKKILFTTTMLAGFAISGAAFAQAVPAEPVAQAPASLLDNLLADATELSARLSNVAENGVITFSETFSSNIEGPFETLNPLRLL